MGNGRDVRNFPACNPVVVYACPSEGHDLKTILAVTWYWKMGPIWKLYINLLNSTGKLPLTYIAHPVHLVLCSMNPAAFNTKFAQNSITKAKLSYSEILDVYRMALNNTEQAPT